MQAPPPAFRDLLSQLSARHELDMADLRSENIQLRSKVDLLPLIQGVQSRAEARKSPIAQPANGLLQKTRPPGHGRIDGDDGVKLSSKWREAPRGLRLCGASLQSPSSKVASTGMLSGADREFTPPAKGGIDEEWSEPASVTSLKINGFGSERSDRQTPSKLGHSYDSITSNPSSGKRNIDVVKTLSKVDASHIRQRHADESAQSIVALNARETNWRARVFDDIALQKIDFRELCAKKYPARQWDDLSAREKAQMLRTALKPRHWLVNPYSNLMMAWDFLMSVSLAFIGLVTPYEVVFIHWTQELPLFCMNRVVDLIFVLDIVLQFFLQVEVQRPHRGGAFMVRDPRILRTTYLRTWFLIDIVSIFPFDILSVILLSQSEYWHRAKILRSLKLSKLVKLLRMARTWRIQRRWKNSVSIPFHTQRLLKFGGLVLMASHWMACLWGLAGLSLGTELCDKEGTRIHSSGPVSSVSWITTLYLGGKISPDDPCQHFDVYVSSLYWAVMTLTSIGYGDITPVRLEEYVVSIICMVLGGVLWAYVIGCVTSIISNVSPQERAFEANTDLLNKAMEEAHVPRKERHTYREFLREAKAFESRVSFGAVASKFSPMLRQHLMHHITKDALNSVHYFNNRDAPHTFLVHVASLLTPRFFARLEPMHSLQHCLCLMDRGTVAHGGLVLVHPNVFHEDFIVTRTIFQKAIRTISLTYTQVLVLTSKDMHEVLEFHPVYARTVYKAAAKIAFCRALRMTMLLYLDWVRREPEAGSLSLSQAFDRAMTKGGFDSVTDSP